MCLFCICFGVLYAVLWCWVLVALEAGGAGVRVSLVVCCNCSAGLVPGACPSFGPSCCCENLFYRECGQGLALEYIWGLLEFWAPAFPAKLEQLEGLLPAMDFGVPWC
ncbi:hypothetical protein Nepgr_013520 [Nepenthes gracilis]|uniref:Secreted protein n=1 Tax=Nepenthes gracilis TaxID=150966 RepID=A0AAD3SJ25_NEPGR|nr:hypothetical protein Nepgr_013520 [Nepenthes gracilis]